MKRARKLLLPTPAAREYMRELALRKNAQMTAEERSEAARHAVEARWAKAKKQKGATT